MKKLKQLLKKKKVKKIKCCQYKGCENTNCVQGHHIVKRGQAKYLLNCKANIIDLCWDHHHGTYGAHGKYGNELDHELKQHFQEYLKMIFGSDIYYTVEQISEKLGINIKAAEGLVKLILPKEGKYLGENIIRECMGGKMII